MRKLDPMVAFLMSLVGLGYLYIGRLWLGVAILLSFFVLLGSLGWTGWIFEPFGIYLGLGLLVLAVFMHWVYPTIVAWKQREVPAKRYNRWYFYVAWVVALQVGAELLVPQLSQFTGFQVFRVPARSMAPTLMAGDWITANAWHYRNQDPQIGEIIAFDTETGLSYVKRLVGVPGDTIELRAGVLFRNNRGVAEPYLGPGQPDRPYRRDVAAIQLGPDQYYVLGDFRDQSRDSRDFGPIARRQLLGRVETICFSHLGWRIAWNRFPRDLVDDA